MNGQLDSGVAVELETEVNEQLDKWVTPQEVAERTLSPLCGPDFASPVHPGYTCKIK